MITDSSDLNAAGIFTGETRLAGSEPLTHALPSVVRDICDALDEVEKLTAPSKKETGPMLSRVRSPAASAEGEASNAHGTATVQSPVMSENGCSIIAHCSSKSREMFLVLLRRALIIGEMEFSDPNGLDDDFEKLMIADSLVCFFAFKGWLKDAVTKQLDRFQEIAERRQRYAKRRGIITPPVFVLSCYFCPDKQSADKGTSFFCPA